MATYIELKQQAQALLDEAEIVRKQEITEVVQGIKAQMKEYGLTVADLGGSASTGQRKVAKTKSTAPAKYRGPNGELWAGGHLGQVVDGRPVSAPGQPLGRRRVAVLGRLP